MRKRAWLARLVRMLLLRCCTSRVVPRAFSDMQKRCTPASAGGHSKLRTPRGRKQQEEQKLHNTPGASSFDPKKFNIFKKKLSPPCEEHWKREDVLRGLEQKLLLKGTIRISQKNFEECFIADPDGGRDFSVKGVQHRNRAFDGDLVAVQVLPPECWIQRKGSSQSDDSLNKSSMVLVDGDVEEPVCNEAEDLLSDAVDEPSTDGASPVAASANVDPPTKETLIDKLYKMTLTSKTKPEQVPLHQDKDLIRTAKVVHILECKHSKVCASFLKAFERKDGLGLLTPKDSRVPRVIVPLKECPEDFPQNTRKYSQTLFLCRIKDWPADSPFAMGSIVKSVGEVGEIEAESEAFLVENEVDFSDFPQEALDCLPKDLPWKIPKEEEEKRRDFRKECVFSIDPSTARDLDDALHVKKLDDDLLEIGVHIADVSFFVHPGNKLDLFASQRATSVYLVQKVIPMLPRLLCEELCSLNPDQDRLTFSVVWKLTSKGELVDEWMGRSIIRSCAKLSYDHAQLMIDEPYKEHQFPPITGGFTANQVTEKVNILNRMARTLRAQRSKKGTLRLDQRKLTFSLDEDSGLPNGCLLYEHTESHSLIEEFMLLANMAVARKIYEKFPEVAFLRRHPTPKPDAALRLKAMCSNLGIEMNTDSAESIQASLDNYVSKNDDKELGPMKRQLLIALCMKIMEFARYFSAGSVEEEDFLHYALNVPFYTHFTSPIRRYADIVVHRQLAQTLNEGLPFTASCDEVEEQAKQCNEKRRSAKIVQDRSTQLFFALFLKECGPLTARGIVMRVLDRAFDVLAFDYGIIKRVYCENLLLKEFKCDSQKLKLVWRDFESESNSSDTEVVQELAVHSPVDITLFEKSLQIQATIIPSQKEN